ncbi:MAG: DUF86 domain-containing protein [Anaerolineae bacterium]
MRNDMALMLDMLLAARNILLFTAGMTADAFEDNLMAQSAVVRELQVIGEAARLITPETKALHPGIAWREIVGMRNRVIHEYFDVRLDIVWDVIQNDIPPLVVQLEAIVPPEE